MPLSALVSAVSEKVEKADPAAKQGCSIPAPEGLTPPDDATDGEAFQGTFRGYIRDGQLHFESINNIPVAAGKPQSTDEEPPLKPIDEAEGEEVEVDEFAESEEDDEEDKMFKKRKREESAFKKAFQS